MTMQPINWSEMDQKYWISDVDGEAMWFESSLDAKDAAFEVALKQAVLNDRKRVERELVMAELVNIDHISTAWLEGFHFAMGRMYAVWEDEA